MNVRGCGDIDDRISEIHHIEGYKDDRVPADQTGRAQSLPSLILDPVPTIYHHEHPASKSCPP